MIRYASVFIKKIPELTVQALKERYFERIDVEKLVPAFMAIEAGSAQDKALDYIREDWIRRKGIKSKTVHNLVIYFFSEREKPEAFIDYLRQEEARKTTGQPIYFEVDYALNVCKKKEKDLKERVKATRKGDREKSEFLEDILNKMRKAQIVLYAIMNLYDKAVKLALETGDINLAKVYAKKPLDKKQ